MNLRHCCNGKVLAGLGVVALGVLVVAPGLLGRILPLLIVAICPLSMLAMLGGMARLGPNRHAAGTTTAETAPPSVTAHHEPAMPVAGAPCCVAALPILRLSRRDVLRSLKAQQEHIARTIARLELEAEDGRAQTMDLEATAGEERVVPFRNPSRAGR